MQERVKHLSSKLNGSSIRMSNEVLVQDNTYKKLNINSFKLSLERLNTFYTLTDTRKVIKVAKA